MRVVKFTSPGCQPCKELNAFLETISISDDVIFEEYDIHTDEGAKTADMYGVMAVPTVLVFKPKDNVDRYVGFTLDLRTFLLSLDEKANI